MKERDPLSDIDRCLANSYPDGRYSVKNCTVVSIVDVNAHNERVVAEARLRRRQARKRLEEVRRLQAALDARASESRVALEAELLRVRDEAAKRQEEHQAKLDAIEEKRLARLGV